jgi:hypothetical protein
MFMYIHGIMHDSFSFYWNHHTMFTCHVSVQFVQSVAMVMDVLCNVIHRLLVITWRGFVVVFRIYVLLNTVSFTSITEYVILARVRQNCWNLIGQILVTCRRERKPESFNLWWGYTVSWWSDTWSRLTLLCSNVSERVCAHWTQLS